MLAGEFGLEFQDAVEVEELVEDCADDGRIIGLPLATPREGIEEVESCCCGRRRRQNHGEEEEEEGEHGWLGGGLVVRTETPVIKNEIGGHSRLLKMVGLERQAIDSK